jgi:hypothetical protein
LRPDIIADQEVFSVENGGDHAVMGLLRRVAEVARRTHEDVRLLMELVDQIH